MKSTFAYRPFWTDTKGLRTIKWPSTLGCHLSWLLNEIKVEALLIAVIRVSNEIVRRQAIGSVDPVHPVSATTWSNKGCWVVMSNRVVGELDSCKKKEKGFVFLFCQQKFTAVPWMLHGRVPLDLHHQWGGGDQWRWRLHSPPTRVKERKKIRLQTRSKSHTL